MGGFVQALAVEGVVYGLALGVRFVLSPAQFYYEDLQRADYDDDGLVPAGAWVVVEDEIDHREGRQFRQQKLSHNDHPSV